MANCGTCEHFVGRPPRPVLSEEFNPDRGSTRAGYDRGPCLINYRCWRRPLKSPIFSAQLPLRSPRIVYGVLARNSSSGQWGALPVVRRLGMVRQQHFSRHQRSETAAMSDAVRLVKSMFGAVEVPPGKDVARRVRPMATHRSPHHRFAWVVHLRPRVHS